MLYPQFVTEDGMRRAEDDVERSAHIRHLLFEGAQQPTTMPTARIPRVIVQFWHDSGDVPPDVAECLDSWRPLLEAGFHRVLFDDASARLFISKFFGDTHTAAFDRCRHPAMRCDYFRLCWMVLRGGFYIDADEWYLGASCDELFTDGKLKVQPLCYDLSSQSMAPASALLDEAQSRVERIFYVNNNPLVAPRDHPVIRLALARANRLLLHSSPPWDIQSTTGPGNLTASLVRHSLDRGDLEERDFAFLPEWDSISISRWPLSYRNDERNWRLWRSLS